MNNVERFHATMNYESVDHPPVMFDKPWPITLQRWHDEGFPKNVTLDEYFEVDSLKNQYAGLNTFVFPAFEEKIISEAEDEIIKYDHCGRKIKVFKKSNSMPEWLEFPIKNAGDLRRMIDEHFDLANISERWPDNFPEKIAGWKSQPRDYLLFLDGGCAYNTFRDLTGVELSSLLFFDAPELVHELFEKINAICLAGLKRVLPEIKIDFLGFGEDVAFKTSTLISPDTFNEFLYPGYKKTVDLAQKYGVYNTWYDSDGHLIPFMDYYFDLGINCFAPCERAAGMDPVELRKRYGKQIKIIGGMDKREISKGKKAIDAEINKVEDLIAEGGYIPKLDHNSIPNDISFENYEYFINHIKRIYNI
jgi:Uroporphyrinogen decarboxylase (URO-D)